MPWLTPRTPPVIPPAQSVESDEKLTDDMKEAFDRLDTILKLVATSDELSKKEDKALRDAINDLDDELNVVKDYQAGWPAKMLGCTSPAASALLSLDIPAGCRSPWLPRSSSVIAALRTG
mgnify:CR=1 FL=1